MERVELIDGTGRTWRVDVPVTHRERVRGLRGRRPIGPGDALWLRRCRSVHTFGMRSPIEAVRLDGALRVLEVRTLPPRRLLLPRPRTRHILELAVGSGLRPGDRLRPPDLGRAGAGPRS